MLWSICVETPAASKQSHISVLLPPWLLLLLPLQLLVLVLLLLLLPTATTAPAPAPAPAPISYFYYYYYYHDAHQCLCLHSMCLQDWNLTSPWPRCGIDGSQSLTSFA